MNILEYHSHPAIGKSGLDLINRSPAHYYAAARREPSKAMALGSAVHAAILEPTVFEAEYLCLSVNDRRTAAYKDAAKNHPADRILTGTENDTVKAIRAAVLAHPLAAQLLSQPGKAEVSLFARDPVTGVEVKARPDFLTDDGYIIDLKTSRDASPAEFSRSIYNYRYHVQAAWYADVYEWATCKPCAGFTFIVVESDLPHNVQVYQLDDISTGIGRSEYRRNLNTYAECLATGIWPGYSAPGLRPELIALPDWAMRVEDDLEV